MMPNKFPRHTSFWTMLVSLIFDQRSPLSTQSSADSKHLLSGPSCHHLLIVFLLLLESCSGDAVQISLSGLRDSAATLLLINLKDTNLLEGLGNLAVNGAAGSDVVGWARATVLGASVDFS